MDGVREEAAVFGYQPADLIGTAFEGVGAYRTFGDAGPMYQVLQTRGDRVLVWLSNSDEEVELPLADVLADPLAE